MLESKVGGNLNNSRAPAPDLCTTN
uniref:Uncharacterized protein n=1 Tax=Arundo donax TaxID=35708 RepID=A0A0A9GKP5_ARUDO